MPEPTTDAFTLTAARLQALDGRVILDGVDLALAVGELAVIVGPSGAGKSRLLRLLDRLVDASAGEVTVAGRAVTAWNVRELRRHVGLVPARTALPGESVRSALALPVRLGLISAAELDARLPAAREIAQLPETLLDRDPATLSDGERGRVAIARALLLEPRLLLLDEPTSALDPETAAALLDALDAWRAESEGRSVVVVTHRLGELLGRDRARLLVLIEGRVAAWGPLAEVLADPGDERARAFLAASGAIGAREPKS